MIFPVWPAPDNVRSASTTRAGGVSQPPYDRFNLAEHVGDAGHAVAENRLRLRQRLNLPAEPLWLEQVHGRQVVDAAMAGGRPAADACVSRAAVMTADCLPVLFCDRAGTAVAAAHAGWRGLAAGVLETTIDALAVEPEQLLAWLGPAIGPAAFEVGDEVREAFIAVHAHTGAAFEARPGGRWLADLYRLARMRLQAVGVHAVFGGGLCTYSDPERFYSFRRERATGRMASLIWLE
jgi:purine-nucleoside/S-methyl-5'-thioadenosine phosphorylase / adenosine deaminase